MEKIRSAVIGCGRIGCGFDDIDNKTIRTHAGSYFKNNETELIALCDIDKQKLKNDQVQKIQTNHKRKTSISKTVKLQKSKINKTTQTKITTVQVLKSKVRKTTNCQKFVFLYGVATLSG